MARKYGEKAQKTVKEAMHKYKDGRRIPLLGG